MASYSIIVEFIRELGDDCPVIEDKSEMNGLSYKEALQRQFVEELQHAYDCPDCGLAGSFDVIRAPRIVSFGDPFCLDNPVIPKPKVPVRRWIVEYTIGNIMAKCSMEVLASTADEAERKVRGFFAEGVEFFLTSVNPV